MAGRYQAARTFSDTQRTELEQAGLLTAQIDALQRALPELVAEHGRKGPTLRAVRDRMKKIQAPLEMAAAALADLEKLVLDADNRARGLTVVRADAPEDAVAVYDTVHDFAERIRGIANGVTEQGRELLACFEGGKPAAPHGPISLIMSVLVLSHHEHRSAPGVPKGDFDLRVSRGGTFARIMRVCYEAAGLPDPERSLLNHAKMLRRSEYSAGERGIEIGSEAKDAPRRKPGRPLK